jgi:UDP-GlcNAc:undecaprenyl-phosphate GlcNAc-1-phosphate transferase
MPLLGGLAMYAACMITILIFAKNTTSLELVGILGGATVVTITGLLDDRGLVHHQIKLFVAMPMAALLLIASGISLHIFTWTFGSAAVWIAADYFVSLVWIVGMTASLSIFDHMDGLCAGVAAIAAACFALLMFLNGQLYASIIAATVLGAALGFGIWNFKPAKLFMGDSGAMFLGFMMAVLGILLQIPGRSPFHSWLVAILVLGVPIFDTILIIISRSRRGLLPFSSPGKDHTAHRLSNLGLEQRRAVLAIYGLGLVCGLLALFVSRLTAFETSLVVVVVVLAAGVGILLLERAPFERQSKQKESAVPAESAPYHVK